MTKRVQRPIMLSGQERELVDRHRELFTESVGETKDWGEYLATISVLALAAVGVYLLVKSAERRGQSLSLLCPECSQPFLMAVPAGTGRFVQTSCPNCQRELLVDTMAAS